MTEAEFKDRFSLSLALCDWEPHPQYSVFTQYDAPKYTKVKDAFVHKYKVFWAVAKALMPESIIELGCFAGSSADAYLSASGASYIGYDLFGSADPVGLGEDSDPAKFDPFRIAKALFAKRGFKNWELRCRNLRTIQSIADTCDLAVVDAAHDYTNALGDLLLAVTTRPKWIWVDDYAGADVRQACKDFCESHHPLWSTEVPHINRGYLIAMR